MCVNPVTMETKCDSQLICVCAAVRTHAHISRHIALVHSLRFETWCDVTCDIFILPRSRWPATVFKWLVPVAHSGSFEEPSNLHEPQWQFPLQDLCGRCDVTLTSPDRPYKKLQALLKSSWLTVVAAHCQCSSLENIYYSLLVRVSSIKYDLFQRATNFVDVHSAYRM